MPLKQQREPGKSKRQKKTSETAKPSDSDGASALKQSLKKKEAQNRALSSEKRKLQQELDTRFEEIVLLTQRFELLEAERTELVARNKHLEERLDNRFADIATLTRKSEQEYEQLQEANSKIAKKEEQIRFLNLMRHKQSSVPPLKYPVSTRALSALYRIAPGRGNWGASSGQSTKREPTYDYIFVIKGKLSSLHLTQVHRVITGAPTVGVTVAVHFTKQIWARRTWAWKHFKKLDYIHLRDNLDAVRARRHILVGSTADQLIFDVSASNRDNRFQHAKPSLVSDTLISFLISPNFTEELRRLGDLERDLGVIVTRQNADWAKRLENTPFSICTAPLGDNFKNMIVAYGSEWSENNIYEMKMVSKFLERDFCRAAGPIEDDKAKNLDAAISDITENSKVDFVEEFTKPDIRKQGLVHFFNSIDDFFEEPRMTSKARGQEPTRDTIRLSCIIPAV